MIEGEVLLSLSVSVSLSTPVYLLRTYKLGRGEIIPKIQNSTNSIDW